MSLLRPLSAPPSTGKAWLMTAGGSPADATLLKETPRPVPAVGPKQVLVKVDAAALNPIDFKIAELMFTFLAKPPLVLAHDFAGMVVEAGAESGFEKGQQVFGDVPNWKGDVGGALSTYLLAPANLVAQKPRMLSAAEAASLPLVAVTALDSLNFARPSEGARVLILGASGGVGTAAVQMCKARGLHVTAVCSGRNRDMVLGLGADAVIDYTKEDWAAVLQDNKVEVVFDFAPSNADTAQNWHKACGVMVRGGRFVDISGDSSDGKTTIGLVIYSVMRAMWRNFCSGFKSLHVLKSTNSEKLQQVAALVEKGQLKPVIEKVYAWNEVHAAYARLMSGRATGKIIVRLPLL